MEVGLENGRKKTTKPRESLLRQTERMGTEFRGSKGVCDVMGVVGNKGGNRNEGKGGRG